MFVGMTGNVGRSRGVANEHLKNGDVNPDVALVGSIVAPLFLVGILVIGAIGGGLPAVIAAFVTLLITTGFVVASLQRSLSES